MDRLVVGVLSEEFGEIRAGAASDWRYSQIEGSENSSVSIQRFVARVADEAAGECRQVNIPVVLQHEFRNQQLRQGSLIEVVANLQARVVFPANQPLDLEREISKAGGEERIFGGAFHRETGERTPVRTEEVRLRVRGEGALIKPREEHGRTGGLPQSSHVSAVKLHRAARAGECGLAGSNPIVTQPDGGQSGHSYGARRNIPSTMRNLETDSVRDLVALCLVYFDECRLLGLIRNRLARTYAGPVEDVQVVQTAFRLQQPTPAHGRFRRDLRRFFNEGESGLFLSKIKDVANTNHLVFGNGVSHVHTVRIVGVTTHGRPHFGIQVSTVEIVG